MATTRTRPSGRRPTTQEARLVLWPAAALVVAVPLAFDPGGYFVFLPSKWTAATVLVAAGVAALVLQGAPFPVTAPVLAWGALLVVLAAAAVVGIGGVTSWIGYPGRSLGVLAWLVFFGAFVMGASLAGQRARSRVALAASAASLLVSGYALLQAAGVDPVEWAANVDESRTRSTLGNAAFLGAYLVLVVPLASRLALAAELPRRERALHATAAALGLVALASTQTRAAWLGLVTAVAVLVLLERHRLLARPKVTAAAGVVGLVALVVLTVTPPLGERIRSITDLRTGTTHGRLVQWDRTLHLVGERPVLGWGPDTYAFAFPRFVDAHFERTVGRSSVPDRAHNAELDVAAAAGLLGVLGYLGTLGAVAWVFLRRGGRDPVSVGLAGAVTAYLVQEQFSFPVADLDTVFWLFAGLLVATTAGRARAVPRWCAALPATLAVVALVAGLLDMAADRALRRGLEAEAHGRFGEATHQAARAVELVPWGGQYLQAEARMRLRVGQVTGDDADFRAGLHAVDKALDVLPRDGELKLDRADLLQAWGERRQDPDLIREAAAEYEGIVRGDPASSRVHLKLGVAYAETGRLVQAEHEWLLAADLAPRASGPLLDLGLLYAQQGRTAQARTVLTKALGLDPGNEAVRHALESLPS